jgi:hypothetical protein
MLSTPLPPPLRATQNGALMPCLETRRFPPSSSLHRLRVRPCRHPAAGSGGTALEGWRRSRRSPPPRDDVDGRLQQPRHSGDDSLDSVSPIGSADLQSRPADRPISRKGLRGRGPCPNFSPPFRKPLGFSIGWLGSSMVEQRPFKPLVLGSSPSQATTPTSFTRIPHPASRVPHPESRIPNPESRIPRPATLP